MKFRKILDIFASEIFLFFYLKYKKIFEIKKIAILFSYERKDLSKYSPFLCVVNSFLWLLFLLPFSYFSQTALFFSSTLQWLEPVVEVCSLCCSACMKTITRGVIKRWNNFNCCLQSHHIMYSIVEGS